MKQRGTKAYIHCFLSKPGTASSGPAPAPPSSSRRRRPLTITADLARSTSRHTRRSHGGAPVPRILRLHAASVLGHEHVGRRRCCWASSLSLESPSDLEVGSWVPAGCCHQSSSSSPSSEPIGVLIRQRRRGKNNNQEGLTTAARPRPSCPPA